MKPFLYAIATLAVATLVAGNLSPADHPTNDFEEPLRPQGSFLLVGGGWTPDSARERFLDLAGSKDARIVLIPCASDLANETTALALVQFWSQFKIRSIDVVLSPADAYKIRRATGVWIGGGDQLRLVRMLQNTPVADELHKLYARGGVIGGTSAGASCVGGYMPYEDTCHRGFGFLQYLVIDQHFSQRQRYERLKKILSQHGDCIGLGIDEGTAVVIRGDVIEILGVNSVTILVPKEEERKFRQGQKMALARK